jgi:WD40 repeat protein
MPEAFGGMQMRYGAIKTTAVIGCLLASLFAGLATLAQAQDQRPWIGFRADALTPDVVQRKKLTVPFGLLITAVRDGSPALRSGLKSGDVIISADGAPVQRLRDLGEIMKSKKPGDVITFGAVQNGAINQVALTLSTRPAGHNVRRTSSGPGQSSKAELMLETGGHMAIIWMMRFTNDGQYLVTASSDKVIRIWDWQTGTTVRTIRGQIGPGALGRPFAIDLSPDNSTLAVAGWMHANCSRHCGGIRFYDFETGKLVKFRSAHRNITHNVKYSPDGQWIATGSADGDVMLWDAASQEPFATLKGHKSNIYQVGFTPDSQRLVSASYDKVVKIWDVPSGREIATLTGHQAPIRAMSVSPDGRTAVTGDRNGQIIFWDLETYQQLGAPLSYPHEIGSLAFSLDGTRIVFTKGVGRGQNKQRVIDVASRQELVSYDRHRNTTFSSTMHPDGRTVATGDFLGEAHVWDLATGRDRQAMAGVGRSLWATAISFDGSTIAWGQTPRYQNNLRRGPLEYVMQLPGPGRRLGRPRPIEPHEVAAFSRAEARGADLSLRHVRGGLGGLVTYDGALEIAVGGRVVKTYHRGRTDGFRHRSYAVSPDGERVITGGNNGIVLAIDRQGKLMGRYLGHNSEVWSLTPSPDARMLVTGSADQTIRFFNLKTRELVASLFHGTNGEWVMWTPQGFYTGSPGAGSLVGWQINRGYGNAADYVFGEQYRRTLRRPEIVERAMVLLSADAATREFFPDGFSLDLLLQGRPPSIRIMTPDQNQTVFGGRTKISISTDSGGAPVRGFELYVNGRKVKANELPVPTTHPKPEPGRRVHMFEVPLFEGVNDVAVVAKNEFGSTPVDANVLRIKHNGEGALDTRGTLHILAIGVDKYPGLGKTCLGPAGQPTESCDLRFAGKDATTFAATLKAQMGPRHQNIVEHILVNDANVPGAKAPTAANIREALARISAANPNDTVVIFLAGHGEQDLDGKYYFLPTDIKRTSMAATGTGDNILEWSTIQSALTTALGRRLLFVDACQSGTANTERAANDQLLSDARAEKFVAFAATAPEQLAEERPDLGHGLFTYALVKGLKGQALDPRERAIRVYGLGGYLSSTVRQLSNGRQTPEFYSGHGDIVLVRK